MYIKQDIPSYEISLQMGKNNLTKSLSLNKREGMRSWNSKISSLSAEKDWK
jgi:hypothetical protein